MTTANTSKAHSSSLVQFWKSELPKLIKTGKVEVCADEKCDKSVLIYIEDDGRSHYSFNFRVKYVDDREIDVQFLDVEKAGVHVDEQSDIVQTTVKEYIRSIHECAQIIKGA